MVIWEKYTSVIKTTIFNSLNQNKDFKYWRDDMFSNIIIYIMPLSLIALIPSVIWAIDSGHYVMTIIDLLCVSNIAVVGFKKGIQIKHRKLLFIANTYILSFFLLYYVGINSTLYLLASCFLSVFIYSFKNKYIPALLNLFISITYIILYSYNFITIPDKDSNINVLFAVFSNLIFLSFLVCILIPKLFTGLDDSLRESIVYTQKIENQNNLLQEITWIQSHVVRAPLSRLLAIAELLKNTPITEDEKIFFLDNIIISGEELDTVIKSIILKSESVNKNK
ncbi:hypothetical protein [Flavobacterium aquicola]|uniref:histidine kinase n=1 Tax=Flavobacterium aquicola TaxID=1682742 RepID=A0A3E0ECY5_9FLAO|nr:hypothetical protein [Flavobacterium aquicola]REG96117.1 hypothetical protein C8P67_11190 [Flavobacterium aquicola]